MSANIKEGSMKTLRRLHPIALRLSLALGFALLTQSAFGQTPNLSSNGASGGPGRPVTVPVTIRLKEEAEFELQNIDLTISEDGEPQTIISIRGVGTNSPITLAVLIQEDLVSVSNEIKSLADFIRNMQKGSRVMVGYLRTGSLLVKQKFTTDLEKAAKALRPPTRIPSGGRYNPSAA